MTYFGLCSAKCNGIYIFYKIMHFGEHTFKQRHFEILTDHKFKLACVSSCYYIPSTKRNALRASLTTYL